MASQLKIELVVDDKGTVKIKNFAGSVQTEMKKAESHVKGFSDSTMTAFKLLGGYLAGGAILGGLKSVTTAFMEQERAVNKMTTAMKNQGDFSRANLKDMENYASQIQETTTVADESALAVMANLKSYGMLNEEVKQAARAAIDFASAKREEGMTVESASELIGKAYMGQTDRLKRYGIVIDENVKGTAAFNAVLGQLQDRFGGAAAAELETYEGRLKNLDNAWGEVKETLGAIALELADPLIPRMKELSEWGRKAAEGMNLAFSSGAEAKTSRKRMAILDKIHAEEERLREFDMGEEGWWGWFEGEASLNKDEIPLIKARIAALNQELKALSIETHQTEVAASVVQPGGKRTVIPRAADKNEKLELAKAEREYEALLREVERESERSRKTIEPPDQNQSENMERLLKQRAEEEKDAAEERMKRYRKMGEDEVEFMSVQTKNYKKELDKREEFSIQSARNMQNAMSDFFFDAMSSDLHTFGDYWGSFWESMKRVMANSLAEMALTWGTSQLKNLFNVGGGSGSILGAIGAGLGTAWDTIGGYATDVFDWATSLFMHEGGLVGKENGVALKSDEMMAVLQKGEYVLPRDLAAALGLSGPGATPGVEGPVGGTMTGLQAFGLLGLAVSGPMAAAALAGATTTGSAVAAIIGLGKIGKSILTILGIESGQMMGVQSQMSQQEAFSILHSSEAYGTAPPSDTSMSLADALGILGGGSYGGAGSSYGGAGFGGFGAFGGYATGGIVPRDQMAKVHRGEGVFTPEQMDRLSAGGNEIIITVPVYIDGRMVSEAVYEGVYDASRRGSVKLHQRGVQGYTETAGIDI